MALKRVRYNGGKESYYSCSKPTDLVVGLEYEVVNVRKMDVQTNYTLKGVEGEYNSIWFDEVFTDNKVYMAIAHDMPVVGKRCYCYKLEFVTGRPKLIIWNTSTVKEIKHLGNSIYHVTTQNSIYIVNVN